MVKPRDPILPAAPRPGPSGSLAMTAPGSQAPIRKLAWPRSLLAHDEEESPLLALLKARRRQPAGKRPVRHLRRMSHVSASRLNCGARLLLLRNGEMESRTNSGFGLDPNSSSVGLDNLLRQRQTDAVTRDFTPLQAPENMEDLV